MSRSKHGPAAGASGGAPVREADAWAPDFLRLDRAELQPLINNKDRTVWTVYMLVLIHSDFVSGEFLGGYVRLMGLMTPPPPKRGPAPPGPTMWDVRKAVDKLVKAHLLTRGSTNKEQGQLRLFCHPRDEEGAKKRRAMLAARKALKKP